MNEQDIKKLIQKTIREELQSGLFTAKKITDTPVDALQVVPRKYVTRNSTTALRPTTSVLGEFYFDTTINKPVWWNGTSYKDAAGNVIS
jgi:hypothetical protein